MRLHTHMHVHVHVHMHNMCMHMHVHVHMYMCMHMCMSSSGVAQANGKNLARYYDAWPAEYSRYRASTSILLPMVGYAHVPLTLKRTLFLDLERYEYRPGSGKKCE